MFRPEADTMYLGELQLFSAHIGEDVPVAK